MLPRSAGGRRGRRRLVIGRAAAADGCHRRCGRNCGKLHAMPVPLPLLIVLLFQAQGLAASPVQAPAPPTEPQREPIAASDAVTLIGRNVLGPRGNVVAQVANVLLDANGQPVAAILDYGGFLGVGRRKIAVAWRALRFSPGDERAAITLLLSQEQLRDMPEYRQGGPVIAAAPPDQPDEPATQQTIDDSR